MKNRCLAWFMSLLSFCVVSFSLTACKKEVDPVIITVEHATENQTLLSYMETLQEDGVLTFEIQNGMITKINGTSNFGSSYWMLYTTDNENANTQLGSYTYNEQVLGSALYGAETLTVKNGETYVWSYETF